MSVMVGDVGALGWRMSVNQPLDSVRTQQVTSMGHNSVHQRSLVLDVPTALVHKPALLVAGTAAVLWFTSLAFAESHKPRTRNRNFQKFPKKMLSKIPKKTMSKLQNSRAIPAETQPAFFLWAEKIVFFLNHQPFGRVPKTN